MLGMWLKVVNADIFLYPMTYKAMGAPKKFRWVDSKETLGDNVDQ